MAIANSDGSIVLSTKVDTSGIKKFNNESKKAFSELGESAKALGIAIATAVVAVLAKATKELIEFSKESSELATKTEASVFRLVDIYGKASKAVGDFIDANATALGMSKAAAASYASVYGNLFSVWADQATNAELTNRYLQTTAVVASKTGRTVEDVQERIRSGLLGNTEAIEDLGIFVNVKTIEMTDAFQRMASGKSWEQLDAYTQQQIRAMAILEQATAKYGDEVASSSALSRSKFSAAWQDFQATWGKAVNTILIPILEVVTEIIQVATIGLQMLLGDSGKILENADSTANSIGESADNQEKLTDNLKETAKAQKKVLAGFDDINILSAGEVSNQNQNQNLNLNLGLSGTQNQTIIELERFRDRCVEILKPIEEAFGDIEISVNELTESINFLEEEIEELGEGKIVSTFASLAEIILGWASLLLSFFTEIFESIGINFDELIVLVDFFIGVFGTLFLTLISGTYMMTASLVVVVVEIFGIIGSLLEVIAHSIGFVVALITGDFEGAVVHLKAVFVSLLNIFIGILNIFIAALNYVWSEIYMVLGGIINTVAETIDELAEIAGLDWNLSWNATATPTIPYLEKLDIPALAQGAVIPPNREFLAVLGDNKRENEIVSPVSTMKQAFMEAMIEMGGNFGSGNTEVVLEIDGREFGRAVVEQGNRENRRIGTRLVIE